MCRNKSPDLVFLIETKHAVQYVRNIGTRLNFAHNFVIPSNGQSGGLAIFWKDSVQLEFSTTSTNFTEAMITDGSVRYCLDYVYGNPNTKQRNKLWYDIEDIIFLGNHMDKPRILFGDLNDIKGNDEKEGGPKRSEASFAIFRDFLKSCGLHEVKTYGENRKWKGKKLSRYDSRWKEFPEAFQAIKNTWEEECCNIQAEQFSKALAKCRHSLALWRSNQNLNAQRRINDLQNKLHQATRPSDLPQSMEQRVTEDMNAELLRPVTEEEIYQAVRHIHATKAPGPDGLIGGFFKDHWRTIKSGYKAGRSCPPISHLLFADDSLLFCKASTQECQRLLSLLQTYGISKTGGFGIYLGLPEFIAGKETLIKYVATSIPTYSMSCFLMPKKLTSKLTSTICRYWWSSSKDKYGLPWIAWKNITQSKSNGGLGFRDFRGFNLALLAKQSWRLLQNPNSLLAKVYKGTNQWNLNLLNQLVDASDVELIKNIFLPSKLIQDSVSWLHTRDGVYTVKSGYHHYSQHNLQSNSIATSSFYQNIWKINAPPKLKHFWWRLSHNALPVSESLKRRGLVVQDQCYLCGEETETANHLFFKCRVAKEIWELSSVQLSTGDALSSSSLHQNITNLMQKYPPKKHEYPIYPFVGWRIWKMRNDLVFNSKKWNISYVINHAYMDRGLWIDAQEREQLSHVPQENGASKIPESFSEVVQGTTSYLCFTDASWKSENEKVGIAWILFTPGKKKVIQGIGATALLSTPLEAEAEALRFAVIQLKRLGFKQVKFCLDSKVLSNTLITYLQKNALDSFFSLAPYLSEIATTIKTGDTFSFQHIRRKANEAADQLAKEARRRNSPMIVSWFYS